MSDYPMHGYLYNQNGTHGPPVVLEDRPMLAWFLQVYGRIALESGLELRLTSGDDEDLSVHIVAGTILHAAGADPALVRRTILAPEPTP